MDTLILTNIINNKYKYDEIKYNFYLSYMKKYSFSRFYLSKLQLYKRHIFDIDTYLIKPNEKTDMIDIFSLYQKTYFALSRFINIYKQKNIYKKYDCDTDLNLTPLKQLNQRNIIQLVENDTVYKFSIYDLIKIIKNSLHSNKYLIVKTKHPSNPYTNKPFSTHNLYNIYFHVLFNTNIVLPHYIYNYFQNNLNIEYHKVSNSFDLKINAINDYIDNEDDDIIFDNIIDLFNYLNRLFDDAFYKTKYFREKNIDYILSISKDMLIYFFAIQYFTPGSLEYNYCIKSLERYYNKFKIKYPNFNKKRIRFYSKYNNDIDKVLVFETYIQHNSYHYSSIDYY
jgi:hypothetical protein